MIGWILFFLSLSLNIVAIWYIKELLVRFKFVQENSNDLYMTVNEYLGHLQKVYDLETYYGDSTLSGLLSHTRDLKEDLIIYRELFSLDESADLQRNIDNDDENRQD